MLLRLQSQTGPVNRELSIQSQCSFWNQKVAVLINIYDAASAAQRVDFSVHMDNKTTSR